MISIVFCDEKVVCIFVRSQIRLQCLMLKDNMQCAKNGFCSTTQAHCVVAEHSI